MAERNVEPIPEFQSTKWSNTQDDFFDNLLQYQMEAKFTDFKILVKDREIPCHRNVLSSSSAYFAAMLGTKPAKSEVRMDAVDYDCLLSVIQYFYRKPISLPLEKIKPCFELCHLFNLETLTSDLERYTIDHITAANAIGWFKFAERMKLDNVTKSAKVHMFGNIAEVCVSDEFKDFSIEEVVGFVKSEDVDVESYDCILTGCIEWVDYNPVARKDDMFHLLKHVDLDKCSAYAIQTVMKKYEDLFTDPRVIKLVCNNSLERLVKAE